MYLDSSQYDVKTVIVNFKYLFIIKYYFQIFVVFLLDLAFRTSIYKNPCRKALKVHYAQNIQQMHQSEQKQINAK